MAATFVCPTTGDDQLLPIAPRTHLQVHPAAPVTPIMAAKLVAAAIATIYVVQIDFKSAGAPDLIGAVASNAVVIAGLVAIARRRDWRPQDFGLRRTAPRFLVGAVLVGSSMWYNGSSSGAASLV